MYNYFVSYKYSDSTQVVLGNSNAPYYKCIDSIEDIRVIENIIKKTLVEKKGLDEEGDIVIISYQLLNIKDNLKTDSNEV